MAFEKFAGFIPPTNAPSGSPGGEEEVATENPVFVNEDKRSATIQLEWPVTYAGVQYDAIRVRRLTVSEVEEYLATIRRGGGQSVRFPMFDVPDVVLDHLDDDDAERVNEAMLRFLPRRFRGGQGSVQSPDTGVATPSS
ncbi:MAG: phage tail assembly protein [Pseudomonadota bacterium]